MVVFAVVAVGFCVGCVGWVDWVGRGSDERVGRRVDGVVVDVVRGSGYRLSFVRWCCCCCCCCSRCCWWVVVSLVVSVDEGTSGECGVI